jgi:CRISPR-associated endonuclease Csn1
LIKAIVDPNIKKLVQEQRNKSEIKDYQGRTIRHVRIKTSAGKEVKTRVNYRSKHDYKNKFYSGAGSIPYAILLQKSNNGKVEREMIPVASFELAKAYKKHGSFVIEEYLKKYDEENKTEYSQNYPNKKLSKVGQKVLVLKEDKDYEKRNDINFQTKRLYFITQFSEVDNTIMLKYHLEAQADDDIDDFVKNEKDKLLRGHEMKHGIPEIVEDNTIEDTKRRKDKYKKEKYSFKSFEDYRFKRLIDLIGKEEVKKIKDELSKYKTQSSVIEIEGKTPLLKMSKENWNFLYEGEDFEISMLGKLTFKESLYELDSITLEKKISTNGANPETGFSEPQAMYLKNKIKISGSFEEMNESDLSEIAATPPDVNLKNTVDLIKSLYKNELDEPIDPNITIE